MDGQVIFGSFLTEGRKASQLMSEILKYNEEDLDAIWFVYRWVLRELKEPDEQEQTSQFDVLRILKTSKGRFELLEILWP